jgi:hypothetical protein
MRKEKPRRAFALAPEAEAPAEARIRGAEKGSVGLVDRKGEVVNAHL